MTNKEKERMKKEASEIASGLIVGLIAALIFIACLALSWAICCGMMYLICLFLPFEFSIKNATGIWLILLLLKMAFSDGGNKGSGEK